MTVAWPEPLIRRMGENRWLLFVGSGVSATARNAAGDSPPTWPALLDDLCTLIVDADMRAIGKQLIERHELLSAADHIRHQCTVENNVAGYREAVQRAVEGPPTDRFKPSELHKFLLELTPPVIFTTNYDKLIETAAENSFAQRTFKSRDLEDDIRAGNPVLVKLHGSTDELNEIVLTRVDFARAIREGRAVFDVLRALSLTATILFVGYSLDDPDVQLVLQEVGRPGVTPEAHFMLAPEPESPARLPVFRESFGVTVVTYPAGDHDEVLVALRALGEAVLAARIAAVSPLT
jgi:hypothetical protein